MCDLAFASENSTFATSGINLGLFCSTPAVGISRAMHPKQAFEMLVTGDFISAQEAVQRGLINQTVHKDDLDSQILSIAAKIADQVSE
jgi:enoyl-CoA hydratase/carnithine racemase